MLNLLTGDDLYAHILLLRVTDPRAVVLLEGPHDCKVLDRHLNEMDCRSIPANGKPSLLRAIELCELQGTPNVVGVLDQDYDHMIGPLPYANIVYVDAHDMDALVLYSPSVLSRVCAELADQESISIHLSRVRASTVRELAERLSWPVSLLRSISIREDLRLNMRDFPIGEVVDVQAGLVDFEKLVRIAVGRSSGHRVADVLELTAKLRRESNGRMRGRYEINGHDAHAVLALVAKRAWSSPARPGADLVARLCRAAFSCAQLMVTRLYEALASWGDQRGIAVWSCPACFA
jgi:hypothetical protein